MLETYPEQMKEMDGLKQQVMMNQFMFATGCQIDQAKQFLVASKWQLEVSFKSSFAEKPIWRMFTFG